MEYLASKTSSADFDMNYTPEKKIALNRVLTSQSTVIGQSLSSLQDIKSYLDTKFTLDDLPLRTSLASVIGNLKYEKEIIDSFKEDLSK